MSRINITVIEPSGLLYGSEFCLLDILDGLSNDRFRFDVIMPAGGGFDVLLKDRGIKFHDLIPRFLHRTSRIQKMRAYWRLYRHLKKNRPDLIYLNQAGLLRAVSACANRLQIPVVCQVQTLEDARLVGQRSAEQSCVQSFICNSEFIGESTIVDDSRKSVLYQGIATPDEPELPTIQKSESPYVVGILGRIAESKGHYLLIDAARQLIAENLHVRFVVIGEGINAEATADFVTRVQQADLGDRFEMRGYQRNIAAELSRIDLLTIPSPAEPLGRVLFDAAAHDVPVVVSDGGGLGELSTRFEIGVRFSSGDASGLASAIRSCAHDHAKVHSDFRLAARQMQIRLSMESYLATVARILECAARYEPCSVCWLGDPAMQSTTV